MILSKQGEKPWGGGVTCWHTSGRYLWVCINHLRICPLDISNQTPRRRIEVESSARLSILGSCAESVSKPQNDGNIPKRT